jgi:diadenosine tetraphosphatase ApaH/serine/threonine PP2A family protein phosphatase
VRFGILGDIHGNLEALDVAIAFLRRRGVDQFLQVGDVVGYGADPRPCIHRLHEIGAIVIAGNHDWAVIGKLDTAYFNPYARLAVEWTRAILSRAEMHFLETLPLQCDIGDELTLVHATMDQPDSFSYILTYQDAHRSLQALRTPVCFMGHSHIPMSFLLGEQLVHTNAEKLQLAPFPRALVNVGSIGQPRDDDPRTAFALYDSVTREYVLFREAYDWRATAAKIRAAGLPAALAERLALGR